LDANFSYWRLTGGWKLNANANVYITNNACSKLKLIAGNSWYAFLKALNFPTVNCPIPMVIFSIYIRGKSK